MTRGCSPRVARWSRSRPRSWDSWLPFVSDSRLPRRRRCVGQGLDVSEQGKEILLADLALIRRHDRRIARDCLLLRQDRKSTRLNSSHLGISYAVFCLKKKKRK